MTEYKPATATKYVEPPPRYVPIPSDWKLFLRWLDENLLWVSTFGYLVVLVVMAVWLF